MNRIPPAPTRASRRLLRRRAFALLWAFAFVLGTVGEGFGLSACPHHEGVSGQAAEAEHGAGHAPASHIPDHHHRGGDGHTTADRGPTHAAHAAHAASSGDCHGDAEAPLAADRNDSHGEHSGPCTCDSACQASAGAAAPAVAGSAPLPAALQAQRVTVPVTESTFAGWPPYFLPLAQAPPRAG